MSGKTGWKQKINKQMHHDGHVMRLNQHFHYGQQSESTLQTVWNSTRGSIKHVGWQLGKFPGSSSTCQLCSDMVNYVWFWDAWTQHPLFHQYFLITLPSITPTSQEKPFDTNRLFTFGLVSKSSYVIFRPHQTDFATTQLSITCLQAVCTVYNGCCDSLVFGGNRCVTAELRPRATWHDHEFATVVVNYSACVGEHLSSLALHAQRRFIYVTVENGILQYIINDAKQK